MIDLHCHILPPIDDVAAGISVLLEMARASVVDGVTAQACTHILAGLSNNSGPQIPQAAQLLQQALEREQIPLLLVTGSDNSIVPDLFASLRSGHFLSLADIRYVLAEPPQPIVPVRREDFFFGLVVAGHVPILTHPEPLTWIKSHYPLIHRFVSIGVRMHITAGSVTGAFGRTAQCWAERMLDEGLVHILEPDAHGVRRCPPNLSEGYKRAAKRLGVSPRPSGVLANDLPSNLPMPAAVGFGSRRAV